MERPGKQAGSGGAAVATKLHLGTTWDLSDAHGLGQKWMLGGADVPSY